jgi:hypothetical protein
MPRRFSSFLTALVLCAAGAAAMAQPASPPTDKTEPPGTVTVQAAPKAGVIDKQSQTFVQTYAAPPNPAIGQLARWYEPVCVEVSGLPRAEQSAAIKARIEDVAQAVGLPAARPGCRGNVEIVFTDRPQHAMDIVARDHEQLLGYYHRHNRDRLKTVTRPIQAWYVTSTRGENKGVAALTFSGLGAYAQPESEMIDDPENQPPNGCGDSQLATACLQSMLRNVFMIADSRALTGKDLGAIADYMVVLALSQPHSLDGCTDLPSVIDLFARSPCPGREPPDGLTQGDAAYLTSLYTADLRARKGGEQSDISRRMAEMLVKAKGARK